MVSSATGSYGQVLEGNQEYWQLLIILGDLFFFFLTHQPTITTTTTKGEPFLVLEFLFSSTGSLVGVLVAPQVGLFVLAILLPPPNQCVITSISHSAQPALPLLRRFSFRLRRNITQESK